MPLASLEASIAEVNQKLRSMSVDPLCIEEAIGCRMYTGPMFEKYNTVLRRKSDITGSHYLQQKFQELCGGEGGNLYPTSIWVINSAIIKLSKTTVVQPVYRGVQGMKLPTIFKDKDEYGVIGGVERSVRSVARGRARLVDRCIDRDRARRRRGTVRRFERWRPARARHLQCDDVDALDALGLGRPPVSRGND